MYVLQVLSGKEDDVKKRLEQLGFKVIVPKSFRYKRIKSKWTESVDVIFKGYVFVDMTYSAENYYKVTKIDGVIKLLRSDTKVLALSYIEEEWIKLLSRLVGEPVQVEIVDEKATIKSGVLKDFNSNILKLDKHKKSAYFELDLLGESHKIVMGIDII